MSQVEVLFSLGILFGCCFLFGMTNFILGRKARMPILDFTAFFLIFTAMFIISFFIVLPKDGPAMPHMLLIFSLTRWAAPILALACLSIVVRELIASARKLRQEDYEALGDHPIPTE